MPEEVLAEIQELNVLTVGYHYVQHNLIPIVPHLLPAEENYTYILPFV